MFKKVKLKYLKMVHLFNKRIFAIKQTFFVKLVAINFVTLVLGKMLPTNLMELIKQYNETGIFIITNSIIYFCNGETFAIYSKHESWNAEPFCYGEIGKYGKFECETLDRKFTLVKEKWQWFLEYSTYRKPSLMFGEYTIKGPGIFKCGNIYRMINREILFYVPYNSKIYIFARDVLLILNTITEQWTESDFDGENYFAFLISNKLFFIQRKNKLLFKMINNQLILQSKFKFPFDRSQMELVIPTKK